MHWQMMECIQQAKAAHGAHAWFRKNVFHCKPISSVYSLNASATSKSPLYEDYICLKPFSEILDWYTSIATWIGQQALLN